MLERKTFEIEVLKKKTSPQYKYHTQLGNSTPQRRDKGPEFDEPDRRIDCGDFKLKEDQEKSNKRVERTLEELEEQQSCLLEEIQKHRIGRKFSFSASVSMLKW